MAKDRWQVRWRLAGRPVVGPGGRHEDMAGQMVCSVECKGELLSRRGSER